MTTVEEEQRYNKKFSKKISSTDLSFFDILPAEKL